MAEPTQMHGSTIDVLTASLRAPAMEEKQYNVTLPDARGSRSMGRAAGVTTTKLNTEHKMNLKLLEGSKRAFNVKNETDREKKMKSILTKDNQYYHLQDNLWNESKFLKPSLARFSADNIDPLSSFKKEVRDLPRIHRLAREEHFAQQFEKLIKNKSESANRMQSRKNERFVNQYQSSQ